VIESGFDTNKTLHSTFSTLSPVNPAKTFVMILGMQPQWSCIGPPPNQNLVTEMAKLSVGSVGENLLLLLPNAISHISSAVSSPSSSPSSNCIPADIATMALQQELLRKLEKQTQDINQLRSSNNKLWSIVRCMSLLYLMHEFIEILTL
jgi:hypothetical protein